ncbi:MAG: adenosine-specific kinase [Calditrichia bacterium]
MDIQAVTIQNPESHNFILGHSHFIKTVEDLYEVMVQSVPGIKFGIAFCEASQERLVRWAGNEQKLIELAQKNAMTIGAGHTFIVFMEGGFPINVLNAIKMVPEVCRIYCATANPVQVLVVKSESGHGIVGVVDGQSPLGIENDSDITVRKDFLRKIGYKQ